MSEPVRRMLVAYDVSENPRRDRVAVELQRFGDRIQYSVFMVNGRPADFVRLRAALAGLIDTQTDRVLFCDLGPRETSARAVSFLGCPPVLTGDQGALIA